MMKIYVWGTGINAINFAAMCKAEIVAFIDNYKKQDYLEPWDLPIITFDEIDFVKEKHFIVVATSENVYHEIRLQLGGYCLQEFKDFCYHEVWCKKIAIVYGNCHILPIKEGLRSNPEFSARYGLYPMRLVYIMASEYKDDFNENILKNCDLFIHQSIREDNKYGTFYSSQSLIAKLSEKCKVVSIPNLYGLPTYYFPQVERNLTCRKVKGRLYYPFRDRFIEKMAEQGRTIEYIEQAICNEEFVSEKELKEGYFHYIEKVKKREEEWDIKIVDVLVDNHKKNRLYYDSNHPTNFVFQFVTKRLLEMLDCAYSETEYDLVTLLDTYEIPVYGQVRSHFGMQWDNNVLMRRYSKYTLTNSPITLNEYIREYLCWVKL